MEIKYLMFKRILSVLALAAVAFVSTPVVAMADETTPAVHLDVTGGYAAENNVFQNQINLTTLSARLILDLNKKWSFFTDQTGTNVTRGAGSVVNGFYGNVYTYDLGSTYRLSRSTSVTAEAGTLPLVESNAVINNAVDVPGAKSNRFVGVSLTTRVF